MNDTQKKYAVALCKLDVLTKYQCSNGGVSSRHSSLDLYPIETLPGDIETIEKLDRAVRIVARTMGDDVIYHVEPIVPVHEGSIGYMAGGSYVTGDSRLSNEAILVGGQRFYGAMSLHDRVETPAEYRALSI